MANLNGLLGGGRQMPSFLGGLLGDEEEYRRLQQQAQSSSLGDMASAFYKAGAPSRVPGGSTLQAINEGMRAQESGYKRSMNEQLQEKIAQQKMRQEMASRDRQAKAQVLAPQLIGQATRPETPLMDNYGMEQAGPNVPRAGGVNPNVLNQLLGLGAEGQKSVSDRFAIAKLMQPEMFSVAPGAVQLSRDPITGETKQVAAGAPKTSNSQLDFAFAKTPEGGGFKGTFEDFKNLSGTKITNTVNPMQPTKSVINGLQDSLINGGERRMRYNQIEATFDPKYLNVPYRAGQAWLSLKEKFSELSEEEKQNLREFSQFRQNSVNNLSKSIQEITGAAMGVEEAKRITAGLPNPGVGLTDGDSPTEFKAKLDQTIYQLKLVEARTVYLLANGLTLGSVSLDAMPNIINRRAKEIAKRDNIDLSTTAGQSLIKQQLSAEFGISTQ